MNREDDATLAAYRIIHPDGPAFSTLTFRERVTWRAAFGEARRIEPVVIKTDIPMELTETSFAYAMKLLGNPDQAVIYCSDYYGYRLKEICAANLGVSCCELPGHVFITRFAWIVKSPDGMVWSAPSD